MRRNSRPAPRSSPIAICWHALATAAPPQSSRWRWRRTPESIEELAARQRAILESVAPLVRPGGTLVYSLCTVTPEETEGVTDAFAAVHPEFAREDLREGLPESWLTLCDDAGALRPFPHRHGGMDAFFAVRFRKVR